MKCVVTGGCGFIGTNLVLRLVGEGHRVVVIDDGSTADPRNVEEVVAAAHEVHHCDYGSVTAARVIADTLPDVVFHLGFRPRVSYSVEHPVETDGNNVHSSVRLLASCRGRVGRVVYASSSSVYGGGASLSEDLASTARVKSPYAVQKLTVETYCRLWSELYGVDTVALRYFNVYGPRQYPGNAYAAVVPAWCGIISAGGDVIEVHGDGTQVRSFVYVDDVVDANVWAATANLRGHEVLNVAGPEPTTINDLADMFTMRFTHLGVIYTYPRKGDVHTAVPDRRHASSLGVTPSTTVSDGLEATWEWWGLEAR